jgi:hypothetical protein
MTGGKATGTASSAELLAADESREKVVIMHAGTAAVAIGIGEAAVADKGVILTDIGDSVELTGRAAEAQINIIGNTGKVTYQTGQVSVNLNGGTPT